MTRPPVDRPCRASKDRDRRTVRPRSVAGRRIGGRRGSPRCSCRRAARPAPGRTTPARSWARPRSAAELLDRLGVALLADQRLPLVVGGGAPKRKTVARRGGAAGPGAAGRGHDARVMERRKRGVSSRRCAPGPVRGTHARPKSSPRATAKPPSFAYRVTAPRITASSPPGSPLSTPARILNGLVGARDGPGSRSMLLTAHRDGVAPMFVFRCASTASEVSRWVFFRRCHLLGHDFGGAPRGTAQDETR